MRAHQYMRAHKYMGAHQYMKAHQYMSSRIKNEEYDSPAPSSRSMVLEERVC